MSSMNLSYVLVQVPLVAKRFWTKRAIFPLKMNIRHVVDKSSFFSEYFPTILAFGVFSLYLFSFTVFLHCPLYQHLDHFLFSLPDLVTLKTRLRLCSKKTTDQT